MARGYEVIRMMTIPPAVVMLGVLVAYGIYRLCR
jgi:hypothetical protein